MTALLSLLLTLLGVSMRQEQIPSTNSTSTASNQCEKNNDCRVSESCRPNADGVKSCSDPCSDGPCGRNAVCSVKNHAVECNCKSGFTGDPFDSCVPTPQSRPSNNIMDILTKRAVGNKCAKNSDCGSTESCRSNSEGVKQCVDPCSDGPCGKNAVCSVKNHAVDCKCQSGFSGDPFVNCKANTETRSSKSSRKEISTESKDGDACEQNNDCKSTENCRANAEGIKHCGDPCSDGPCGRNASCSVVNHSPLCTCPSGYTGDPFVNCEPKTQSQPKKKTVTEREARWGHLTQRDTELTARWGHLTQSDTDEHTCMEDSECPANTVCRPDSSGLRKCLDEVISAHMGGCNEGVCVRFCYAYGMTGICEEVVKGGEKKCFCRKS